MSNSSLKKFYYSFLIAIISVFSLFVTQVSAEGPNVGEIDIDFIHSWEHMNQLHLEMDMETSTGIYMQIKNESSLPATLQLAFVDGEMAEGEPPVQACKTTSSWVFWRSVALSGESIFTLQPWEIANKSGTIQLLSWYAGDVYGCLTLVLLDESEQGTWISIIARKANLMSIAISWEALKDFSIWDLLIKKNKDHTATINFSAFNNWTISENIKVYYIIKNALWYEKEVVVVEKGILLWGDKKDFIIKTDTLPRYWGNYTVTIKVDHFPIVEGEEAKITTLEKTGTVYLLFSIGKRGLYITIAWLLLFFLFLFFWKRRKKDEDEEWTGKKQKVIVIKDTKSAPKRKKPIKMKKRPLPQ